jgi:large subunit ribosomal protein L25
MSKLEVGHSIHLSDLKLPKGVAPIGATSQESQTIATASIPAGKVEAEGEAAPAAAAAPATPPAEKK